MNNFGVDFGRMDRSIKSLVVGLIWSLSFWKLMGSELGESQQ